MAAPRASRIARKPRAKMALPPVRAVTPQPRLLYLVHNHPALAPGGTEIFAHRAFRYLRDECRREIFFLAATGSQQQPRHGDTAFLTLGAHSDQPADEFLFFADAFDFFLQSSRQPSVLVKDFVTLLRDIAPDIVHIHHTLRFGMEVLPLIKSTLPGAKIVYTLHDFVPICHRDGQMLRTGGDLCERATPARCHQCFPEISPERFLLREQFIKQHLASVDRFISPSAFLARRYIEWGIAADKITVIPNGQLPVKPAKEDKRAMRNRFRFFGQITPYKGVLELIEAAGFLTNPSIEIHLHGGMSQQSPEFQARVKAALDTAPACVTYHGAYTPDQLPALMAQSDWVLVPSIWWENAPLVIDEAFAHGKPVICSGIGGMAEKVTDGVNGLHMPPAQPKAMAERIQSAASDTALYDRLCKQIRPPLSLADSMARHEALYAAF